LKKKILHIISICIVLSLFISLTACGSTSYKDEEVNTESVTEETSMEEPVTEQVLENEPTVEENQKIAEETEEPVIECISVKITVVNQCTEAIGMFSIINPLTEEQMNLSGIGAGDAIVITLDWPTNVTTLDWAVYTQTGELYSESTSDVTGLTESITITLVGTDTIDDISVFPQ